MGSGRVLHRQPAKQQFIGLDVGIRLFDRMRHVVGFGKEAGGAQHHHRQAMLDMIEAAKMFGRKLGNAIDIAWLGRHRLGQPGGLARTTLEPVAYRL